MSLVLKVFGAVDLASAYFLLQTQSGLAAMLALVFAYKGLMSLL